jgi:hypothetical protein
METNRLGILLGLFAFLLCPSAYAGAPFQPGNEVLYVPSHLVCLIQSVNGKMLNLTAKDRSLHWGEEVPPCSRSEVIPLTRSGSIENLVPASVSTASSKAAPSAAVGQFAGAPNSQNAQ